MYKRQSQSKQNLSAARNVGNSVANILLSAICMPLILKFSSAVGADGTAVPDARGYFMVAVIFSVAMIPTFWIAASCKETYGSILHKTEEGGEKRSILDSIKTLLKNDQLVLIILNTLGGTIAIMGRMTPVSYTHLSSAPRRAETATTSSSGRLSRSGATDGARSPVTAALR